ncbi:MAG: hypothetical protein PWP24_817, partial [Clostridiales bacterium]|nr:hypothetical protein [Clostridiales bacterium]
MFFRILLMAISLSMDALAVGISYAMKNIRLSFFWAAFIGFINAVVLAFAMVAGNELMGIFPENIAEWAGSIILFLAGLLFIKTALSKETQAICDLDDSKDIKGVEAGLLAIALSVDSLSVGIAAASFRISYLLLPFCVGVMQMIFLLAGGVFVKYRWIRLDYNAKRSG